MTSSILSQGEIDALLDTGKSQSPSNELLSLFNNVAQQMSNLLNELSAETIDVEGPFLERLEKGLKQNIASQALAVAADLAEHEMLLIMSLADAKHLANGLSTTPLQSLQMLSQAWVTKMGELLNVPYRIFQAQEVNLGSFASPKGESKAYLARHSLEQGGQKLEFCVVVRDSDKFERFASQAFKKPNPTLPIRGDGAAIRGSSLLKGSKSPVTEAVFTPIGDLPQVEEKQGMNLLEDIDLHVTVELGRTSLTLNEILELKKQSVIRLERHAGEPVDIYVNNNYVAKAEVVVLEDNFGVRILEIVPKNERAGDFGHG